MKVVSLPRGNPVTVVVKDPIGVDAEVSMVSWIEEQAGLQGLGLITCTPAPEGRTGTESVTGSLVPDSRVLVI